MSKYEDYIIIKEFTNQEVGKLYTQALDNTFAKIGTVENDCHHVEREAPVDIDRHNQEEHE